MIPYRPTVVFEHPGYKHIDSYPGSGACNSFAIVSSRGYAALPLGLHLPTPIVMDVMFNFSASRNTVTVEVEILSRTQFPDFELRVTEGLRFWYRGVASPFSGPETGLLAPLAEGPSFSVTLNAETQKCCGGTC